MKKDKKIRQFWKHEINPITGYPAPNRVRFPHNHNMPTLELDRLKK